MKVVFIYDAYCAWCYGFGPVLKKIRAQYEDTFTFEILSGGMILPDIPAPISVIAPAMLELIPEVTATTGIQFGDDYLWHLKNPDQSDWFPNSLQPAIAVAIIKDLNYDVAFDFASDMQYGLFEEGRDLTDKEAYRHLLEKYEIDVEDFYKKMDSESYEEKARHEFSVVEQLHVGGFPATLLQISLDKFYLMSNGYLDFESLENRFQNVVAELNN